ncbi:ATP-binding protein [Agaribacterium sp. ZY112]|uniref:hybrid sensor histidine kinase/response regulator n=1 Tax=Agaribacterium sp. ZY112 TaxID=3233574 RepID=UPI0035237C0A
MKPVSIQRTIHHSINLKLALPVIGASFVLCLVVLGFVLISSERQSQLFGREDARLLVNSLSLISEVDATEQGLRQAVNSLKTEKNVKALVVVNMETESVIASLDLAEQGLPYSELRQGMIQNLSRAYLSSTQRHEYSWMVKKRFHLIRQIQLLDSETFSYQPYIIFIDLDLSSLMLEIRNQNLTLAMILIGGLALVGLALFTTQSNVVIKPINIIVEALKRGHEFSLIRNVGRDEIGVLAQAYNHFTLSSRAREETLRLKTIELEHAIQVADEASKAKSEFLASMSHEIRTPMNGVLGMLSLLENGDFSVDQQHKFSLAKSSAESLLTLINDILDFSKIEAGKLELDPIDFNLSAMLGDLSEVMALRAEEKGLELNLDLVGVEQALVYADVGRIRQVFTNLVGNAVKFTDQGSICISVKTLEQQDGSLLLDARIIDTGIGIPIDKQAQLFEAFTQEDASTTRKYGGTGLGLAISRLLCELMGGSIVLQSAPGKGSTFRFRLKLEVSKQEQTSQLKPRGFVNKLKILLLSQSEQRSSIVLRQLREWQIECLGLENAEQALEQLGLWTAVPVVNSAINPEHDTHHVAVLIDNTCGEQLQHHFSELLNQALPDNEIQLILMRAISEQPDELAYLRRGYFHSFPTPVTKQDLISSIELLNGSKRRFQCIDNKGNEVSPYSMWLSEHGTKQKLLLVEDNLINQEVAMGLLEGLKFDVECVNNGLEALALLNQPEREPFTLILMDCQMPEMDGFECTEQIRQGAAGEHYKGIPIVALTANAMQGDRELCIERGMNDYLSKPISSAELARCLYRWMNVEESEPSLEPCLAPANADQQAFSDVQNDDVGTVSKHIADKPALEDWHQASALERAQNKPERLARLAQRFLDDMPNVVELVIDAAKMNNWIEAKEHAHALKGVAANMSALQLRELAYKAECAAGEQHSESLLNAALQCDLAMQRLSPLLESYIAGLSSST